jgi:SAM-dependent methyltransferase
MPKAHDAQTLSFYATEAAAYAARSDGIGPSKRLATFTARLKPGAAVLDLGCGTGRDTQALIEAGFAVTAIDGSSAMAQEAERRTGRPVRVQLFEDIEDVAAFDGIWASASLLHVPREGLPAVLHAVYRALKPNGLLFATFKGGGHEGRDTLGRYYNYLDASEVRALIEAAGAWTSIALTEGRGKGYDGTETPWTEVWAEKKSVEEDRRRQGALARRARGSKPRNDCESLEGGPIAPARAAR